MEERKKAQQSGEKIFQDGDVEIRKMDKQSPSNSTSDQNDDYIDYEEVDG